MPIWGHTGVRSRKLSRGKLDRKAHEGQTRDALWKGSKRVLVALMTHEQEVQRRRTTPTTLLPEHDRISLKRTAGQWLSS